MELRPFQAREIPKILGRKRSGISWDMGLGKTLAASTVGAQARLRRWLIICPDNAVSVWGGNPGYIGDTVREYIHQWWPEATIKVELINEEPWGRNLQWNTPYDNMPNHVHIRMCTIDVFIRDWAEKKEGKVSKKRKDNVRFAPRSGYHIPEIVIYDEARRIRNKDTISFKILQAWMLYYSPTYFLPMTGTPGHEPKHFWTMLNLINPKYFGSYWNFVQAFHMIDDTGFGLEVNEPKNLPRFHQILSHYFSIVKEEEVEGERPPLTRQLLPIEMDNDQQRLYRDIQDEMMTYIPEDDKLVWVANEFTIATRLRQILVCPRILSPSLSVGNAIVDFAETMEPNQHAVIFTPFTSAFPHFTSYLSTKGFRVQTLQGGIGTEERDRRIQLYRSERGVIICSILYAQAFSLEPATKCFFIGYDWDPDNNRQAEKRLHRLTTTNPIAAYYYTYKSTFDERIAAVVNLKQQRVNMTIPQFKEMLTGN
jgi:hypothetical protein